MYLEVYTHHTTNHTETGVNVVLEEERVVTASCKGICK